MTSIGGRRGVILAVVAVLLGGSAGAVATRAQQPGRAITFDDMIKLDLAYVHSW